MTLVASDGLKRRNRDKRDAKAFSSLIGGTGRSLVLPANIELFVSSSTAQEIGEAVVVNGKTISVPALLAGQVFSVGWHEKGRTVECLSPYDLKIDLGLGNYAQITSDDTPPTDGFQDFNLEAGDLLATYPAFVIANSPTYGNTDQIGSITPQPHTAFNCASIVFAGGSGTVVQFEGDHVSLLATTTLTVAGQVLANMQDAVYDPEAGYTQIGYNAEPPPVIEVGQTYACRFNEV